jgi:hypothetical protein
MYIFKVFSYTFKIYTIDKLIDENFSIEYHLYEILVGLRDDENSLVKDDDKKNETPKTDTNT